MMEVSSQNEPINLWQSVPQPDILGNSDSFGNITWTSDEIIENLYEPLRKQYPQWVNREKIGMDTTQKYEMYAYSFTPKQWKKTVYIQSGVHSMETEGYFGLARLMHLIANEDEPRLKWLRENVLFFVFPMVSVWGISNKGSYEQLMSADRYVKCLHNVLGINPNRDFYECQLAETKNVKKYFASKANEIDVMFDFHTTTNINWGAYLLPYPDNLDCEFLDRLVKINKMLYRENCTSDIPIAYMGDESHYPTTPINSSFMGGFHKLYNISGSTIEHSDYIFDSVLGTSVCMTRAVELYANHIMLAVGI